jgi:predicted RNA-binding Zn-ribbon protein involved in translation (DUF1610 family)
MGLPTHLSETLMTFECPKCGLALTRKGSWFRSASRFKCAGCGTETPITYDDKIRLFDRATRDILRPRASPSH